VEVNHSQIDPLYGKIAETFADLDKEEVIKKFISMEFNRFLQYYKNAPDLNAAARQKSYADGRPDKRRGKINKPRQEFGKKPNARNDRQKFTSFRLNVGRRDGILPQGLMGKINGMNGGDRIKIGKIEIMRNTALLEADSRFTPQILDAFDHFTINGKEVSIKVANDSHHAQRPKTAGVKRRKPRKAKTT
jgi:ATP-dependent RNA helicase DeaD